MIRRRSSRVRMHSGLRQFQHWSQYAGNATVDRDVYYRAAAPALKVKNHSVRKLSEGRGEMNCINFLIIEQ